MNHGGQFNPEVPDWVIGGFLKYFLFCFVFFLFFSNFTSHKAITFWWPECEGRKEGNVLFNDALNTFYLWLYGVRHMVKDSSNSERKPAAATWATLSD